MGMICIDKTTGRFREWARYGTPPTYNPSLHTLLTQDDPPPDGTYWDGAAWMPLPPKTDAEKAAEAQSKLDGEVLLKALALWCAQHFGLTPSQARSEIATIYKTLV